MQTPRFTTVIVDRAETLLDTIRRAAADNHICDSEIRLITEQADGVYRHAMVNDLNTADIVARLRTGPDSHRAQRTDRELRNGLRLLHGGHNETRHLRDNGDDAA